MLDPVPFRERDLDPEAEAFIVDCAQEFPHSAPLRIIVHLPSEEAATPDARGLPHAMRTYFSARARALSGELRELFRIGRISLAIGCAVLAACLGLSAVFAEWSNTTYLKGFASEGLLILGWVALWRPMEIFLFDWWPIARRRTLYRRLADADVRIAVAASPAR